MKLILEINYNFVIYNLSFISSYATEVSPSLVTDLSKKVISINVNFQVVNFISLVQLKKIILKFLQLINHPLT